MVTSLKLSAMLGLLSTTGDFARASSVEEPPTLPPQPLTPAVLKAVAHALNSQRKSTDTFLATPVDTFLTGMECKHN